MNIKHTKVAALATALITFGSLAVEANAAILITFKEVGGDVIATTSGSIVVPNTQSLNSSGTFLAGSPNRLSHLSGNIDRYSGGTFSGDLAISKIPSSGSGTTFGIEDSLIYFDASAVPGSTYTPTTTWTWSGETISSIGLDPSVSLPLTVYTASNGETVSIIAPEPSSALLSGLGALGLAVIRRRKTQ
ncbi:PEP-CTERM sorting domain-containing protein [Akkermansiaceae bacterium]|nr:PEP-CTERM sorting domain-containing protein [Akkermansiaceae bacterium]